MQISDIKQFALRLIRETNANVRNYIAKWEYFKTFINDRQ